MRRPTSCCWTCEGRTLARGPTFRGAVNLPHARIDAERLVKWPDGALFVVYCAGAQCNGADRAAVRLAELGQPVKLMLGA